MNPEQGLFTLGLAVYFGAWLLMAALAIANGIVREKSYASILSERSAHQLSTAIAAGLVAVPAVAADLLRPFSSAAEAWTVGACWLGLTVAFEFGFGHWVAGHSWSALLNDYNLRKGRLWGLFLCWLLVLPVLCFMFSEARA